MKRKHGHSPYRSKTPTYSSWSSMKMRCNNHKYNRFQDYGGRGIGYDPEWESFEAFYRDMGDRPEGTTLDRINCNGDYCKSNCRWSTPKEQASNRRRFSTSSTGVNGVAFDSTRSRYQAFGWSGGKQISLYNGRDFDAACKARADFDTAMRAGEGEG